MWSVQVSLNLPTQIHSQASRAFDRLLGRGDLNFLKEENIDLTIKECEKNFHFFDEKKHLVVIGLGGSSLGTKAFCQGLFRNRNNKIFFLDNVDATQVDFFLEKPLIWNKVAWLIVSKSGQTIETLSLYNYCHSVLFQRNSFSIIKNTAVITATKNSPLYDFATENNCPLLPIPADISGRFSVFTPVGLFPLIFMGESLKALRENYKNVLKDRKQIIEVAGQLWASHLRKERNLYSFQYCDRLRDWSFWLQQLWSESLSKKQDCNGQPAPVNSTLVPCRGVSDQHSVLQQIVEGLEKKFILFHKVREAELSSFKTSSSPIKNPLMNEKGLGELLKAEALATQKAIENSDCQTMTLTTEKLSLESLSQLMTLWMFVVGTLGELFKINTFNQPGVESGKKETRHILSHST